MRPAVVADAEAIARIHVAAWQDTYAHLVDPAALAALDPATRVDRWREIVRGTGERAWLAELDGEAVAWATTSDRDPSSEPRALELNGVYALTAAHGSGAGQALFDAAIGDSGVFLWVAADNPRAQAFYMRNGLAPDGASSEYDLLGSAVTIVRWVR